MNDRINWHANDRAAAIGTAEASGECAWCSAPATTVDEQGDPQCEVCARSVLQQGLEKARAEIASPSLDRRAGESRWRHVSRLVRRLSFVRQNGPASEEIATMGALERACGVSR